MHCCEVKFQIKNFSSLILLINMKLHSQKHPLPSQENSRNNKIIKNYKKARREAWSLKKASICKSYIQTNIFNFYRAMGCQTHLLKAGGESCPYCKSNLYSPEQGLQAPRSANGWTTAETQG